MATQVLRRERRNSIITQTEGGTFITQLFINTNKTTCSPSAHKEVLGAIHISVPGEEGHRCRHWSNASPK